MTDDDPTTGESTDAADDPAGIDDDPTGTDEARTDVDDPADTSPEPDPKRAEDGTEIRRNLPPEGRETVGRRSLASLLRHHRDEVDRAVASIEYGTPVDAAHVAALRRAIEGLELAVEEDLTDLTPDSTPGPRPPSASRTARCATPSASTRPTWNGSPTGPEAGVGGTRDASADLRFLCRGRGGGAEYPGRGQQNAPHLRMDVTVAETAYRLRRGRATNH